ncbi:Site-specific recombinase XerD [Archaeoglobus sulfaticallidus PM70-1]|uniref:Site-specific recombinase XerD n=1 Tax=Archaeoglobus sulfaticallidus PM70-1 TaxID=387631 RepID=N0BFB0_9EURY|nr:tyrosine-type recombinase/integrase [Archaeoglobus sulfaticallidus]AGK60947.1 Site-specific recombinase XerD [Archaeoglobus sulfaticallidus PM70-1]
MDYMEKFHKGKARLEKQILLLHNLEPENRDILFKFKDYLVSESISPLRILRYVQIMRMTSEWVDKPLTEWGRDEIIKVLGEIETRNYKVGTKNEFRKAMKKFFRWLHGENWENLKLLKKLKEKNRLPVILSEEEVFRMVEVAEHPRDKAMIAVWYEAGLRVAELATLQIKDIVWYEQKDELRAKIKVRGKTGERVIPLVLSVQYLKRWIDMHPFRDDLNAIVFCSFAKQNYGGVIDYQPLLRKVKEIAKKAGIRKRVYTHILRHSRASVLANYLTEAQMCEYFGWEQGSDMPKIYVHLSGRDIDKAVLRIYGLENEEKEDDKLEPKRCPRCNYLNAPTDRFCGRCALILDEEERLRFELNELKAVDELTKLVANNPELVMKAKEMLELVERLNDYQVVKAFLEQF